jgi:uncharacterized membrane protein YhdT
MKGAVMESESDVIAVLIYVAVWVVCAFLVGAYAASKGRDRVQWDLTALLISPLIAFVVLAVLPEETKGLIATGEYKKCPQCAETVRAEAKICRYCRSEFPEPVLAKINPEGAGPIWRPTLEQPAQEKTAQEKPAPAWDIKLR